MEGCQPQSYIYVIHFLINNFFLFHFILFHLISFHFISSNFISFHLISSHFIISSSLISSQLQKNVYYHTFFWSLIQPTSYLDDLLNLKCPSVLKSHFLITTLSKIFHLIPFLSSQSFGTFKFHLQLSICLQTLR